MIIYEEILREFARQKVKYVLVGGIAFNLLGGYRTTLDMDILVEMTDKNIAKVVQILVAAGYHVKQPVDPMLLADKKAREDWIKNKNLKAFNFYKGDLTYEEVDILIDSVIDYKKAACNALRIKAGGLSLSVISRKDLIKMKKAAGREKDLRDIEELKIFGKTK